jgi:hypothetical protein
MTSGFSLRGGFVSTSSIVTMWCQHCRQDVPAISQGETARCVRCGRAMARPASAATSSTGVGALSEWGLDLGASVEKTESPAAAPTPSEEDDWLLDHKLRLLKRKLNIANSSPGETDSHNLAFGGTVDRGAYPPSAAIPSSGGTGAKPATAANPHSRKRRPAVLAWMIMSLGLMSFVCGGVLLAWSFIGHRNDLWGLGMPITLVGQFGLLLGLVLQLDHLWQASRHTADTLNAVDDRLSEINHATTLLRTTHSSHAQSFYAHYAEGAHPHLLLADLKGQLDLLSAKMSQQR